MRRHGKLATLLGAAALFAAGTGTPATVQPDSTVTPQANRQAPSPAQQARAQQLIEQFFMPTSFRRHYRREEPIWVGYKRPVNPWKRMAGRA